MRLELELRHMHFNWSEEADKGRIAVKRQYEQGLNYNPFY